MFSIPKGVLNVYKIKSKHLTVAYQVLLCDLNLFSHYYSPAIFHLGISDFSSFQNIPWTVTSPCIFLCLLFPYQLYMVKIYPWLKVQLPCYVLHEKFLDALLPLVRTNHSYPSSSQPFLYISPGTYVNDMYHYYIFTYILIRWSSSWCRLKMCFIFGCVFTQSQLTQCLACSRCSVNTCWWLYLLIYPVTWS